MADPKGARAFPLFLDQTEAQRAEKIFWGECPPTPPPPPLFQGLDRALL